MAVHKIQFSSLQILSWGIFCACSWTWCIGMYLPVILADRFGWPGVISFALPNVIGVVMFGFVVATREKSEHICQKHSGAMLWFSVVTVAFHVFFLDYLFTELNRGPVDYWYVSPVIVMLVWGLSMVASLLPNRDWLILSIAVYVLSVVTFIVLGTAGLAEVDWTGRLARTDLYWLLPTLCFGFLLCPFLDRTFHRALQHSPSRHSFAVFGIAFPVMLAVTCVLWHPARNLLPTIALAHILGQSLFTMGAHLREIRVSSSFSRPAFRTGMMAAPLLAAGVLPVARMATEEQAVGENMYLRFLVFYGLVFPTYVLMRIIKTKPVRKKSLVILLIVFVFSSLPLYEYGFLHDRTWLLVFPIAVLSCWWLWRQWNTHTE